MIRPAPSSAIAASGSTSRNSGLEDRRSTQSLRVIAIRFAISTRRAEVRTRFIARFWLALGCGDRSSDTSNTAAS